VLWDALGFQGRPSRVFVRFYLLLDTDRSGAADLEEVLVGLTRCAAGMAYRDAPFRTYAPEPRAWETGEEAWSCRTDFLFHLYDVDANGWLTPVEVADMVAEYECPVRKARALHDSQLRSALDIALGPRGRMDPAAFAVVASAVPYLIDPSEEVQLALSAFGRQIGAALRALGDFFGSTGVYDIVPVEEELFVLRGVYVSEMAQLGGSQRLRGSPRRSSRLGAGAAMPRGDSCNDVSSLSQSESSPPFRAAAAAAAPTSAGRAGTPDSLTSADAAPLRAPLTQAEAEAFELARKGDAESVENLILFTALSASCISPDGDTLLLALLRSPWAAEQAAAQAGAAGGGGEGEEALEGDPIAQLVHRLLGCGVPAAARDGVGRTAAELASELGLQQVAWLLDDAAGRTSPSHAMPSPGGGPEAASSQRRRSRYIADR